MTRPPPADRDGGEAGGLPEIEPPGGLPALVLYQLVFLLAFLLWSPVLAWRLLFDSRYRRGLGQRLGLAPRTATDSRRRVVWMHAVSVGELKAAREMIARLRAIDSIELVVSCTTPTGRALAGSLYPDLRTFYYPLDFGPCPALAMRRLRPACVLLVELEYWPNFLWSAARRRIPVAVINGRISEKSYRGYRRIRGMAPPFGAISRFCVQDASYRRRLIDLGVRPDRVFVTGNMKYDSVTLGSGPESATELRRWLGDGGVPVVVCGSTHGGEDRMLLGVFARLRSERRLAARVVLAPRHPERAPAVADAIASAGLLVRRWSACRPPIEALPALAADEVVLVDTIGHLEAFYAACDVAFVGGSLVPHGGQNMLEPAALGRAVVFGPHTHNFRNDVELLLGAGAARRVDDPGQLFATLTELLTDGEQRRRLGEHAVELIARNQGATARTLRLLAPLLGVAGEGSGADGQQQHQQQAEHGEDNGGLLQRQ